MRSQRLPPVTRGARVRRDEAQAPQEGTAASRDSDAADSSGRNGISLPRVPIREHHGPRSSQVEKVAQWRPPMRLVQARSEGPVAQERPVRLMQRIQAVAQAGEQMPSVASQASARTGTVEGHWRAYAGHSRRLTPLSGTDTFLRYSRSMFTGRVRLGDEQRTRR